MYILKKHCKLSLCEQLLLSAEERSWLVTRFNKDMKNQNNTPDEK